MKQLKGANHEFEFTAEWLGKCSVSVVRLVFRLVKERGKAAIGGVEKFRVEWCVEQRRMGDK